MDRPPSAAGAVVLVALAVAVVGGCASQDAGPTASRLTTVEHHGLFVEYDSVDELMAAADAVVTGTVLDGHTELIELEPPEYTGTDPVTNPSLGAPEGEEVEPSVFVYTVYDVEVTEAVQGHFEEGDRIRVRLVGGQHGDELHVWGGVVHPAVGETYAFFLSDVEPDEAEALNPTQSLFLEVADGEFAPLSRTVPLGVELASDLGVALD